MRLVIFLLALSLISSAAFAKSGTADYELNITKGIVLFNDGDYAEASEKFNSAVSADPQNPAANWWLGVSRLKAGYAEEAIVPLVKATSDPKFAVAANYYMGIAYYRLGSLDDAKDAFDAVLALSPSDELKISSREYLDEIEKLQLTEKEYRPAKPWAITLASGIQYDSNAILIPDDDRLVSLMGVWELSFRAIKIGRRYFQSLEMLIMVALIYWVMCIILQTIQEKIEKHMARGERGEHE